MDVRTLSATPNRRDLRRSNGHPPGDQDYVLQDVIRIYREIDVETIALRGVDLTVAPGEFVALMGRSGSGKSTLLNIMAGSDRPTAGRVLFRGRDLATVGDDERSRLRGSELGIVYQSQNLAPMLSLVENVRLSAWLAGRPLAASAAEHELVRVGLGERLAHRPDQLSGGEQQRGALACVMAARPSVVLADEITGELDSGNAELLLQLLRDSHIAFGTTIVLVTHDPAVARTADRVVELRDGRVTGDRSLS